MSTGGITAVVRQGGTERRVSTSPWAHVVYERQYHTALASWATVSPPTEHVYYLVHAQLRVEDPTTTPADFDTWLRQVDDIELLEQPDPTQPPDTAPSPATSSS